MKNSKEFKLIECSGTPYEIGRQWGEGCKESILKISENICNGMALFCKASKEEFVSRAMKFLPAVQEFDPYLVEIMRGQADATGLSLDEIFTQKCFNVAYFRPPYPFRPLHLLCGNRKGNARRQDHLGAKR